MQVLKTGHAAHMKRDLIEGTNDKLDLGSVVRSLQTTLLL